MARRRVGRKDGDGAEDPEKQDVKIRLGGMGGAKGDDAKTFDSDDKSNK